MVPTLEDFGISVNVDNSHSVSELTGNLRFLNGRLQSEWRILTYGGHPLADIRKPSMATEWRDVPMVGSE